VPGHSSVIYPPSFSGSPMSKAGRPQISQSTVGVSGGDHPTGPAPQPPRSSMLNLLKHSLQTRRPAFVVTIPNDAMPTSCRPSLSVATSTHLSRGKKNEGGKV